jgi:hypothetical protein
VTISKNWGTGTRRYIKSEKPKINTLSIHNVLTSNLKISIKFLDVVYKVTINFYEGAQWPSNIFKQDHSYVDLN